MLTEIPFNLPGKIFRSPMPFSPYDKSGRIWSSYEKANINLVVILAEKHEYIDQTGQDLIAYYRSQGIETFHYPIKDFQVPLNIASLNQAMDQVIKSAEQGKNVSVHCMAGLGRTGLFLACMAKRYFKFNGQDSMEWIRETIPGAVENRDQEEFIQNL